MKAVNYLLVPYKGFSKETWRIFSAGFINAMSLMIIIYLSLYLNSLHYSVIEIGIVLSLFGFFSIVGGYLGGLLSDRLTPLRVCKISLLSSALLLFPLGVIKVPLLLIILMCGFGVSSNIFRPAFILTITHGEHQGSLEKIVALRRVAINLGMAFGAAISGFLASKDIYFVFVFNAFSSLISFLIIFSMKDQKLNKNPKSEATGNNQSQVSQSNFYFLLVLMFFILLVFNQSLSTYPLFLKNSQNFTPSFISFLYVISGVLIAFFQVPITHILKNKKSNFVCASGVLLIGLGFLVLPWAKDVLLVIFSCVLWTFGEIILFPAQLAMLLRASGEKKGGSMGLYQTVFSLASFFSPMLGMSVYAYDGNLIWYLSGLTAAVIALLFLCKKF